MTRIIRFPGTMTVATGHPRFYAPTLVDTFNRADGALLGSTTSYGGGVWAGQSGPLIASNRVSMASVTANGPIYLPAGNANHEVRATLAEVGSTPATAAGGVVVRHTSAAAYVWLNTRISSSVAGYKFWQLSAGVNAGIGTEYAVAAAPGDVLKVQIIGTTLTAWVNGVLACTATTVHATGSGAGFLTHTSGLATRWDDFSAAPITA